MTDALIDDLRDAWRRNNDLLLLLLQHVPSRGFAAIPAGSRGRDVAAQFAHLDRVRRAWLEYHTTGKRPAGGRYDKSRPPTRAALRKSLAASGKAVDRFLARALRGEARVRMFGGRPTRWLAYLLAHDAHHRGQILLALKQNGFRIPDKVALDGLWGRWISSR